MSRTAIAEGVVGREKDVGVDKYGRCAGRPGDLACCVNEEVGVLVRTLRRDKGRAGDGEGGLGGNTISVVFQIWARLGQKEGSLRRIVSV